MPLLKKQKLCYDNIILRGKAENQRKYTPLMFDQNEKKKNCYVWSSSDSYTLERKKIKPITMLRRLVGNHGSLSNMNLKYHVSYISTCRVVFELCGILIISIFHI